MTELGKKPIAKALASAMMLLVLCTNFPLNAFADTLTVDLTANGQNALTLATSTDSFTVSLATTGATACQMTSPAASGVSTTMSSSIAPGHPWYPAVGGSTTFTVTCTDGVSNVSDTVVVSLGTGSAGGSTGGSTGGAGGSTGGTASTTLSVDIQANGSNGPVTLASGQPFSYSWTSTGATACQLTSPAASGISTSGVSASISTGHPWYPSTTTPTTLTIVCTDGVSNVSDSVVVQLGSGSTGGSAALSADIKANGSDGPVVTITPGSSWTYSWSSTGATACQLTSPAASGISTSGTSASIAPGHPWYPTSASSTTLTLVCTDGVTNASDSVTVALGTSGSGGATNPTVTVLINGTHAATINNGDSWTYTWNSANATACQQTSPAASGISLTGTSSPITVGHPWYPAVGSTTTITVTCTNGVSNATDSATVTVVATTTPPSGGGGSTGCTGNCGGGGSSSTPPAGGSSSFPPPQTGSACLYVRDYMRADFQNNPVEVMKLQSFLKVFEGYDYVTINGVYDAATIQAVDAFQMKYFNDILAPWGLTAPTHYTYILTLKKVNELYCLGTFPLNEAQAQEIQAFHDLITGLRAQGINPALPASYSGGSRTITVPVTTTETITSPGASTTATTTVTLPIVGISTTTESKGQSTSTLAAVLFAAPKSGLDALQCIYEFLLILIVLYILGNVLEDVLYKKEDLTKARARFYAKWTTIALGLIIGMIVAYKVLEWCLILPLLVALILSLVWMALYQKHSGTYAGAKAWVVASGARAKTVAKETTTTTTTVENKPTV